MCGVLSIEPIIDRDIERNISAWGIVRQIPHGPRDDGLSTVADYFSLLS